jgi:hypothetical protein
MKPHLLLAAAALFAWPAQGALAANDINILTMDDVSNVLRLHIEGDNNALQIDQENPGGPANSITLNIEGDLNGGPLGARFTGAALTPGLQPGTLVQKGYGNSISFDVTGSSNLFAVAQLGNRNMVTASISGSANQASIMQVGNGNVAGFSQAGIGNTVSIMQRSW